MDNRALLAVIPGEPAGVGPELAVRAAADPQAADLLLLADPATLRSAAESLALPLHLQIVEAGIPGAAQREWARAEPHRLLVRPVPQAVATAFGQLESANAAAVIDALNLGSDLALAGQVHGLVTGPTHKHHLLHNGFEYLGTTEWLAARAGTPVVMMLAHARLRVALVTTHLPLRDIASALTAERLAQTLRIVDRSMRSDYGLDAPRLTVLGPNPHAGENGALGTEEIEIYAPVMAALRAEGMTLRGPLPADTAFIPDNLRHADVVVAAYHDQGLPVLKFSGFEDAVNITLGLPYPRVAVDHGTALDLAGSGRAHIGSWLAAINECARIAAHRRQ